MLTIEIDPHLIKISRKISSICGLAIRLSAHSNDGLGLKPKSLAPSTVDQPSAINQKRNNLKKFKKLTCKNPADRRNLVKLLSTNPLSHCKD